MSIIEDQFFSHFYTMKKYDNKKNYYDFLDSR